MYFPNFNDNYNNLVSYTCTHLESEIDKLKDWAFDIIDSNKDKACKILSIAKKMSIVKEGY
jgi:hypothetical protein